MSGPVITRAGSGAGPRQDGCRCRRRRQAQEEEKEGRRRGLMLQPSAMGCDFRIPHGGASIGKAGTELACSRHCRCRVCVRPSTTYYFRCAFQLPSKPGLLVRCFEVCFFPLRQRFIFNNTDDGAQPFSRILRLLCHTKACTNHARASEPHNCCSCHPRSPSPNSSIDRLHGWSRPKNHQNSMRCAGNAQTIISLLKCDGGIVKMTGHTTFKAAKSGRSLQIQYETSQQDQRLRCFVEPQ